MKKELHIVNGGSLAGSLRETRTVSDVTFWREALYSGPLAVTDDISFTALRETFWERRGEWVLSTDSVTYLLPNLTELITRLSSYERIVLWFEFDLYDQSMLWYVLRQFKDKELPPLFIISPDTFPGIENFRGMGQLQPAQLVQLFGTETPVTPHDISAAVEAWEAFASSDQDLMQAFLAKPCPLPYAKRAMEIHVAQFPRPPLNLGDIQIKTLEYIGKMQAPRVYQVVGYMIASYDRDYGLSDIASIEWLVGMEDDPRGLIEFIRNHQSVPWDKERIRETSVRLTEAGKKLFDL